MAKLIRRGSANSERGAAAVEFALLLPLLVLLVFGIIDFGRAINAQITITQAAREGARALSLSGGQATYQTRSTNAAIGLNTSKLTITEVHGCQPGDAANGVDADVKVTYSFSFITPIGSIFGSTKTLTAEGVIPCET
jgi:Flp pilus assembly protein TadG